MVDKLPKGWYVDPHNQSQEIWWDGEIWHHVPWRSTPKQAINAVLDAGCRDFFSNKPSGAVFCSYCGISIHFHPELHPSVKLSVFALISISPTAGWYVDPHNTEQELWWDGGTWDTESIRHSNTSTTDPISRIKACAKCSKKLPDTALRCPYCGVTIDN